MKSLPPSTELFIWLHFTLIDRGDKAGKRQLYYPMNRTQSLPNVTFKVKKMFLR